MADLKALDRKLAYLHHRRAAARWATGLGAAAAAVLFALLGIFLVDVAFETDVPQRLFLIVVAGLALLGCLRRFAWPHWRVRESRIALALQVERHEEIDNDLVAAMQFAEATTAGSGSPRLQRAVIANAERLSASRPLDPGPAVPAAARVAGWTALAVLLAVGVSGFWPEHVRVFARRLCLASPHYPTRSTIERIQIDDAVVLVRAEHGTQPRDVTRAEGSPVFFRVWSGGRIPDAARVRLETDDGRQREIPLERMTAAETSSVPQADGNARGEPNAGPGYGGHLPRLLEPARFQVLLGDAWSDPARIRMVPLPAIAMTMETAVPDYARSGTTATADPRGRHVAVLEGSRVGLRLKCTNGKRLRSAWIEVLGRDPATRFDFRPVGSRGTQWELAAADGPLERITEELRFQVQVIDQDGLSLETPLAGWIRIQPDRPPTCSASLVHRVVLPTATPVIAYRVTDDYALASVCLEGQLERGGGGTVGQLPQFSLPIAGDAGPWMAERLPLSGDYRLDLSAAATTAIAAPVAVTDAAGAAANADPAARAGTAPLGLAKGDRLKLTVVAEDYRGGRPGQTTRSEPMLLEISDESGVLTAISEADEQSEQRLGELIKQQLGIGDD